MVSVIHGAHLVVLSCALTVLALLCYDGAELASRGVVAPYVANTIYHSFYSVAVFHTLQKGARYVCTMWTACS